MLSAKGGKNLDSYRPRQTLRTGSEGDSYPWHEAHSGSILELNDVTTSAKVRSAKNLIGRIIETVPTAADFW